MVSLSNEFIWQLNCFFFSFFKVSFSASLNKFFLNLKKLFKNIFHLAGSYRLRSTWESILDMHTGTLYICVRVRVYVDCNIHIPNMRERFKSHPDHFVREVTYWGIQLRKVIPVYSTIGKNLKNESKGYSKPFGVKLDRQMFWSCWCLC